MGTKFLAYPDEHPVKNIYSDGSKTDQCVSLVSVFQNSTYSGRLPDETPTFTAKMYVIWNALTKSLDAN